MSFRSIVLTRFVALLFAALLIGGGVTSADSIKDFGLSTTVSVTVLV